MEMQEDMKILETAGVELSDIMLLMSGVDKLNLAARLPDGPAREIVRRCLAKFKGGQGDSARVDIALANAKNKVKEERGVQPEPLTLTDAQVLIDEAYKLRRECEEQEYLEKQVGEMSARKSVVGLAKFHCKVNTIDTLEPILIENMFIGKHHKGHYLLCRIVAPVVHTSNAQLVIADTSGAVVNCEIHNYPLMPPSLGKPWLEDWSQTFYIGRVFIIKEPYLQQGSQGTRPTIRIDTPTDIDFLNKNAKFLGDVEWKTRAGDLWTLPVNPARTFEQWRALGNKFFKDKEYLAAENSYSIGILEHSNSEDVHLLYLNRAQTYLKLERYASALKDSEMALSILAGREPDLVNLEKALYRKATALYNLRDWSAALSAYKNLIEKISSSKEGRQGVEKTAARIQEGKTGNYDMLGLFERSKLLRNPRLDVADFIGPVRVGLSNIEGAGRGIFTTRAVKAGELLMACKALAICYKPEASFILAINLINSNSNSATQTGLASSLMGRLLDQPGLVKKVDLLYTGGKAALKLFNLAEMQDCFSNSPEPINPAMIERAITFNGFNGFDFSRFDGQSIGSDDSSTAIYLQTSLINHSCVYNSYWITIGDVQFVRAAVDLPKDSEVLISYSNGTFEERQKNLAPYLGAQPCVCELCQTEGKEGKIVHDRRDEIAREETANGPLLPTASRSQAATIVERRRKTVQLYKATYSAGRRSNLKPDLFNILLGLASALKIQGFAAGSVASHKEAIQTYKQVLECVGATFSAKGPYMLDQPPRALASSAVTVCYAISLSFVMIGQKSQARNWIITARTLFEHLHGKGLFEKVHAAVVSQLRQALGDF